MGKNKKNDAEQISLFNLEETIKTNILDRIATQRIPDRALTNLEAKIINHIKITVQELCERDPVKAKKDGIVITLNPADIASKIKSKNSYVYISKVFDTLIGMQDKKIIPAETIYLPSASGEKLKRITYSLFSSIASDEETKNLSIRITPEYINYVTEDVLPYPEVRLLKNFLYSLSSKYSTHFINMINDEIGAYRKLNGPQEIYEVVVLKEYFRKRVPTKANYVDADYARNVIDSVIEDVNSHEQAPYSIINPHDYIIKKGRSYYKYRFVVKMKNNIDLQPMFLDSFEHDEEDKLYDDNYIPNSWDYLLGVLDQFHVDDAFKLRIKNDNDRERVWKTFLYVSCLDAPKRTGAYFNKAYTEYYAAEDKPSESILRFYMKRPELVDDLINSAMNEISDMISNNK